MILTKADLKEYLEQDKRQLGITRKHPRPFLDSIWKYEIELRKYEYWLNSKDSIVSKMMRIVYKLKHDRRGERLGIGIPPNVCGKGLSIAHYGCIQINNESKIGDNLRIHEGVTLGASGDRNAPIIGNNVFLGSGCKVIGKVKIPDNCAVGAGAVVVKDVREKGVTVGGVPAKVISHNDSAQFVYWYNEGQPMV